MNEKLQGKPLIIVSCHLSFSLGSSTHMQSTVSESLLSEEQRMIASWWDNEASFKKKHLCFMSVPTVFKINLIVLKYNQLGVTRDKIPLTPRARWIHGTAENIHFRFPPGSVEMCGIPLEEICCQAFIFGGWGRATKAALHSNYFLLFSHISFLFLHFFFAKCCSPSLLIACQASLQCSSVLHWCAAS